MYHYSGNSEIYDFDLYLTWFNWQEFLYQVMQLRESQSYSSKPLMILITNLQKSLWL